jgi:hypothetical protein
VEDGSFNWHRESNFVYLTLDIFKRKRAREEDEEEEEYKKEESRHRVMFKVKCLESSIVCTVKLAPVQIQGWY